MPKTICAGQNIRDVNSVVTIRKDMNMLHQHALNYEFKAIRIYAIPRLSMVVNFFPHLIHGRLGTYCFLSGHEWP